MENVILARNDASIKDSGRATTQCFPLQYHWNAVFDKHTHAASYTNFIFHPPIVRAGGAKISYRTPCAERHALHLTYRKYTLSSRRF